MNPSVAYDAPFAYLFTPSLELGFHQGDHLATRGQPESCLGQQQAQRDKRCIHGHEVQRLRQTLQVASVGSLHDHDARILAQPPVELAVPNINGIDPCSPMLQEAIRETPCRSAHISHRPARRRNLKGAQSFFQFEPTATDVGQAKAQREGGLQRHQDAGLVHNLAGNKHLPGKYQPFRFFATISQTSLMQESIQPHPGTTGVHRGSITREPSIVKVSGGFHRGSDLKAGQVALHLAEFHAKIAPFRRRRPAVWSALLRTMRPKQWAKNVFIFAGLFFDGRVLELHRLLSSLAAFALFCLVSSAIYLINDLVDIEKDRLHPTKRNRPLASGALSPKVALVALVIILVLCLPTAFAMSLGFGGTVVLYVSLMILYSFKLKHIVIIDVMTLAAGFVIRVLAGAIIVQVSRFSPWLYVCATLAALFFSIAKRRHELVLLAEGAESHRSSLQDYNLAFLDDMMSLVTTTALVAYSFYTFSAPNLPANHMMMLTIPLVMYGIFRYLYLVRTRNLGGAPEDIVLGDKPLLVAGLLWVLLAGLAIYLPKGL
jgi:4-hydroxybenzoate polyprenyltransferase